MNVFMLFPFFPHFIKNCIHWLLSNNVIIRLGISIVITVILVISFLSCWIFRTTSIWIEMTSIPWEHFIWFKRVLYILRNGNMSGLPSWLLRIAKNDTAYSQFCLHHTCGPSILDVTTNILHTGCRGCFVFVSLWLYSLFFSPTQSCDTDRPCFHCHSNDHLTRFLENTFHYVLTHYCDGMSAGEQQLLE